MASLAPLTGWLVVISIAITFVFGSSAVAQGGTEGEELYQYWCSTCHGDRGQGLTDEWRATWPEDKQYCWQSKCHASNHPPEGFTFPKEVPALVGEDTLSKFNTAQDLHAYLRATMPYWAPNSLSAEEYQAITAFLVKSNYTAKNLPTTIALADDLGAIPLHPAPARPASPNKPPAWLAGPAIAILVTGAAGVWLWFRKRRARSAD
jgi:mono/diheme cytochrome c family protein